MNKLSVSVSPNTHFRNMVLCTRSRKRQIEYKEERVKNAGCKMKKSEAPGNGWTSQVAVAGKECWASGQTVDGRERGNLSFDVS